MNRNALFKYTADLRPATILLINVGMSLVPFVIPMAVWFLIPYLFVLYFMRSYLPFVQHNHGHLPTFNNRVANWFYDVLLAQMTGYSTALWELHHCRGHHRHFLTPEKDVARITRRGSSRIMSRWIYPIRGNLVIYLDAIKIGLAERRAGKKSVLPKLSLEFIQQLVITAALVAWNPWMALWCFILPNAVAAWFVWWESYTHHLHVPSTSIYDGSITVMSRLYNYHTFNIGHHTAHHEKPTLHWSLLPKRTTEIRSRIPDTCVLNTKIRRARRQTAEVLGRSYS